MNRLSARIMFTLGLLLPTGLTSCTRAEPPELDPAPQQAATQEPASQMAPVGEGELGGEVAGVIFGVPVPTTNYYFAKRVSYMFPRPWEERATPEEREEFIWQALILHYDAFRQGVEASDEKLEERINSVLRREKQPFTRSGDPEAYAAWVKERINVDVPLFENQMRYLLEIDMLKDQMRESFTVTVSDEEMQEEFLNEHHHVGGEMVTFDTLEEARAFFEQVREPAQWEAMKEEGAYEVRPVGTMTLEAYIALWGIPKDQIYAFHALETGSVGEPMPFGTQWSVYRLLDKRTGNLEDFPNARDKYRKQLTARKQHQQLKQWIDDLKASANLTILPSAVGGN